MTDTRAPLDPFETALLHELRREVVTRAAAPARPRRRRVATLAAVGTAAAAAVVGPLVLRPDAAFAVEREPDGDVVVTIKSLEDAEGLEEALAAEGVDAEVTYDDTALVPTDLDPGAGGSGTTEERTDDGAGPQLSESELTPAQEGGCGPAGVMVETGENGDVTFTLDAAAVDSDAALRLTTAGSAEDWMAVSVQWLGDPC